MPRTLPTALIVVLGVCGGIVRPADEAHATLAEGIDEIFAEYDSTRSPGCSVALMRDGQIAYKAGYGMANLDHDVPIRSTTVFHVASVSKQFTAAAIVLLALDGKLSLDDEVRTHVPELPDFGRKITIRHLVHHVSGIRDQWDLLSLGGWRYTRDLISDADVLWILERQKDLNFEPGAEYLYSNSGYTLLAQIVARVSGKSFREFTRERIFEPLGMDSTFFRDDFNEIVKHQAYGYVPNEAGVFRLSVTNFDTVGATSLLTTVEDLARWNNNFDEPTVGGEAFIEQIHERFTLNDGKEIDYAFGISHGTHRGLTTVSHSGGDAGYRSHFVRFPEQRVAVACLCNVPASPRNLALGVAELVLADQMEEEEAESGEEEDVQPVAVPVEALAAKEGLFWEAESDGFLEFEEREGTLYVISRGTPYELVPLGTDHLRVKIAPVELEFEDGEPMKLTVTGDDVSHYERVESSNPTPEELETYAGTYRSDELDIPYRLRVEEGMLVLHRMKAGPESLRATMKDVFVSDGGTVRFERDANGDVSGFLLTTGRIRNLEFRRQSPIEGQARASSGHK